MCQTTGSQETGATSEGSGGNSVLKERAIAGSASMAPCSAEHPVPGVEGMGLEVHMLGFANRDRDDLRLRSLNFIAANFLMVLHTPEMAWTLGVDAERLGQGLAKAGDMAKTLRNSCRGEATTLVRIPI